jgi:NAD(P)H-nitrite reductase large subunit
MQYLIIGCGAAAVGAGKAIMEHDPGAELTFTTYESTPFYLRPLLSNLISGDVNSDALLLPERKLFEKDNIRILTGKRACKLEENLVIFTDGDTLPFNFLLIATGAHTILNSVFSRHKDKIHTLRNLSDAIRFKDAALKTDSALVVGCGVCAYEAVRVLHKLKIKVTFLKDRRSRASSHEIPEIEKMMEDRGIPIITDIELLDILDWDGQNYRILTSSGEPIQAGLIVAALGYEPDVRWLEGSDIQCDRGIMVNEELQTNIPNIYAAGDVAQVYLVGAEEHRLNFGWQSAIKQGEVAGQNMAGRDRIYLSAQEPYFQGIYGKKFLERW